MDDKAFTAQKMKFSIKDLKHTCFQLRISSVNSHLLKKSLIENIIFYAVFRRRQQEIFN